MFINLLLLLLTSQTPVFGECLPVLCQGDTLDIGSDAAPLLTDWNRDGLIDILIGCRFPHPPYSGPCGSVYFFPNSGSPSTPSFEENEILIVDGDTLCTNT